jgi:hypothetical protein
VLELKRFSREIRKVYIVILIAISVPILIGFSILISQRKSTEDKIYLTPIPEETLRAYTLAPINDKLQAAIAARIEMNYPLHFNCVGVPKTVSVEKMSLQDAQKRVEQPGSYSYEDKPGNTKVWFVVFECDIQVYPPDPGHTITPEPPFHGCSYVILQAKDGEFIEVGGYETCTTAEATATILLATNTPVHTYSQDGQLEVTATQSIYP